MKNLELSIIRTLAFFDIFSFPLTSLEIFKWLNVTDDSASATDQPLLTQPYFYSEVQQALNQLPDKIQSKNGFYFLAGRSELINQRLKKYGYAANKFKRALGFSRIFSVIPYIKMIAVCNTLAYGNSSQAGDIDLFIIAQKNRLWLTRFLAVGFLKLLGVRPTKFKKQNTIDPTFFLSAADLDIERLKIGETDVYLTYWIDQLAPVYDVADSYQSFQQANGWVKKSLPNSFGCRPNDCRQFQPTPISKIIGHLIKMLTDWQFLENWVSRYQLKIMPLALKEIMNQDSRVVVNDKMLKFHLNDRRNEYQKSWQQSTRQLI